MKTDRRSFLKSAGLLTAAAAVLHPAQIFAQAESSTITPDAEDVEGFKKFLERYQAGLSIERAAVDCLK